MKKLYLSELDKKIFGVCGGLGEYFDVDPTVIRLLTVVVCLITMILPCVIAYLIAWLIIPQRLENQ